MIKKSFLAGKTHLEAITRVKFRDSMVHEGSRWCGGRTAARVIEERKGGRGREEN